MFHNFHPDFFKTFYNKIMAGIRLFHFYEHWNPIKHIYAKNLAQNDDEILQESAGGFIKKFTV